MVARTAHNTARGDIRIAALLTVALALAGCGAAEEGGGEANASDSPATSSPSAPTDPFGPAAPDEGGGGDGAVLSWIPLGPSSPSDPPEQNWYPHLRDRSCSTLRSLVENEQALSVWPAAATICEAMETGDEALWARGKAEVAALGSPPTDSVSCFNAAVHHALHRAIAFHEAHPDVREITTTTAKGTACPLVLTGLRPEEPSGEAPACGSDWFLLVGRLLPSTFVTVDGVGSGLDVTTGHFNRLYFRMPEGEPGQVATVDARTADGVALGSVTYQHPSTDGDCEQPGPGDGTPYPPATTTPEPPDDEEPDDEEPAVP